MTDPVAVAEPDEPRPRPWRLDTRPLRTSPDFRRIWSSGLITYLGSMTTYVALPYQIKELTGSLALAGLLSAVELVPIVVFGLWGGALADALDRRRMVLAAEAAMLVLSGLLTLNALLPAPKTWVLFVVAGLFAMADSMQRPSLDAMIQNVVSHDQMAAVSALGSIRYDVGAIAGPAFAGLVLTLGSTWLAYAFDVSTYVVSLAFLLRVRHVSVPAEGDVASVRGIVDGLRYAWSRKDLLGTYAVDIVAMFFGMTTTIMPFVATVLDAPWAVGLLFAAPSVGSLAVSATSGWTAHVHRQGVAIALAAAGYGAAMTCVGFAPDIWVALVALAVAGGADMVSGIFRDMVWNQTIPSELRGRLAGVELLSYSTGPILGNARAGLLASATSVRFAIWSGGLLCIGATAAATGLLRQFRSYDDRTSPHAAAQRRRRGGD
ncbi:MAG: MFS transporter [Nocardioidaceae bacterium]